MDAGLRFDASRGSAAGAARGITWSGFSPRLLARFVPVADDPLTLLAGYAWYRNRLPLNLLAYGDPNAAYGGAYRWDDLNADGLFQKGERGPLVARVGPGGSVASIDPDLRAPQSREVFVGFETSQGSWKVRMLGYYRRERDLVTSVNFGAPLSAYDVYYIEDPSDDITGTEDDHLLPVYNRRPESFGQDQYLLTNDPEKGTGKGLEITIDGRIGKHLRLLIGATASKTFSPAAYRGFLAIENDQGLVGERLELPNAATLSKGRLFFERGYTVKIAGVYQAPWDLRLGAVARYQDGQHFARFVIPTDLNQGPEPIKGIYNGDSRFCYVFTIDARIEKGFAVGRGRLAAVFDVFNVRGTGIEVEEDVIWGPSYRATSAVQPPRAIRLGLRTTSSLPILVVVVLGGTAALTQAQAPAADASPRPRPRVAVALSGGGARGIAHIGALRALEEAGIPVDALAANSMGAVVGGIYATGRTADELELHRQVDGLGVALQRPAGPADAARRPPRRPLRPHRRDRLRLEGGADPGGPRGRAQGQPLPDPAPVARQLLPRAGTSTACPSPSAPWPGTSPRVTPSSWPRATSPVPCARACRSRSCSRPSTGRAAVSWTA